MIQVLEFAGARAPELQALHEIAHHDQMAGDFDRKLEAQRNQRRRRANAFNSYKIPQRLRRTTAPEKASDVLDFGSSKAAAATDAKHATATKPDDDKRCRKHRRRPQKLVQARSCTNKENTAASNVLPTHVWHAKRMKMVERWGMRLAKHRSDKSVTAALQVRFAGFFSQKPHAYHLFVAVVVMLGTAIDGDGARHVVLWPAGALWPAATHSRSAPAHFRELYSH